MQRIAGIDGCKSGWIIVESDNNLRDPQWRIASNWNEIADVFDFARDVIAVDMPIGLSSSGVRQCEVEGRRILSRSASRIFKTLPRETLCFGQDEWIKANQWSKSRGLGGISKQIWNIRPKILEIERHIRPRDQRNVHEAHPELAFLRLNGGQALPTKHSEEGLKLRRTFLKRAGFSHIDLWLTQLRGSGAKADDLLDACVLVLTAQHLVRGSAVILPRTIERDRRGLRMSIGY